MTPMKRCLARLAAPALLALMTVAMAIPGCATSWSNLAAVNADVNEVTLVLSTVETFTDQFFVNHPNPAVQTKVDAYFARVKVAASAVQSLARAGGDFESGQGAAALSELYAAYTDTLALVKSFGVTTAAPVGSGARMAASPGAGLVVPAAKDLMIFKGRKVAG